MRRPRLVTFAVMVGGVLPTFIRAPRAHERLTAGASVAHIPGAPRGRMQWDALAGASAPGPADCPAVARDRADSTSHSDRILAVNGACLEVVDFGGSGPLL